MIEFKGVNKTFYSGENRFFSFKKKKITVFNDLSISIKKGEIVALLGCNGAGKTTMFKLISTLLYPNTGQVTIKGYDPMLDPISIRKAVSFIPSDENSFYFRLSGLQNVNFFSILCDFSKKETLSRLQKIDPVLGVGNYLFKRYQEYSTGMKQKLNLARGLIRDYEILLLDEPIKSIDPSSAAKIMDHIKSKARNEGKTVLLTTHKMQEVEKFAERFIILDKGTAVADFGRDKLKNDNLERIYQSYVR